MANSTVLTYTADGATTDFTISFAYLDDDFIIVKVEDEGLVDVTGSHPGSMFDASTYRFDAAVPNNYRITFTRSTDLATDLFTWTAGSVFRPSDIGDSMKMLRDYTEETRDQVGTTVINAQNDAVTQATSASAASAAAAATSEGNAATSAGNALTSESNAAGSAAAAATSAGNALTSESNALGSAAAAATSAGNALTSESNALGSAAAAATSAGNALTSEGNASGSAAAAATSAGNAATSAATALAAQDVLLDIYLGSHVDDAAAAAHASTEGYTVDLGDLYFNTTTGRMMVYNGSAWVGVASSVDATNAANSATAAQTAQTAAESALTQLLNKYHGAHANDSACETDISGDADLSLEAGDLYFNTTSNTLRYYDGSAWYDAAATQVIDTSALGNVGDVTLTGLATGDLLRRNGAGAWVNYPDSNFATAAQGTAADAALPAATYTAADVKTKYETNANTNAFTDAEQTKLAGIETGATADQTGADIKTLYEAEADTNAFTDAEKTKLTGIETGATADQTGAEIKTLYEGEANAFTDALYTKLTGLDRDIPQNAQTAAYILAASDAGGHVSITTGGVTVDASVFAVGDAISIYNNSGSDQTITQGTSVTLRNAGTADTGNRTLAQYGLCTVLCVATDTFVISGVGLT